MANSKPLLSEPLQLRIVLIGKVGGGKTATVNTIVKATEENEETAFQTQIPVPSNTTTCQKREVRIARQTVLIVDTPGLCHPDKSNEEEVRGIKNGVSLADPGPHALLIVLDLQCFTIELKDMVEMIWENFGGNAAKYAIALFTHGNELKRNNRTIKDLLDESEELKKFVDKCNGGWYVIENNNQEDPSQVTKLINGINKMVKKNEGTFYKQPTKKSLNLRSQIALAVNGSALGGAGVGAGATYLVGSPVAIPVGAALGAGVGGVLGGLGILAAKHIKAKGKCVIQ